MKYILLYIINLSIFFSISSSVCAQDAEEPIQEVEKVPLRLNSIKIGHDIGKYADFIFKPERTSYVGSLDIGLSDIYFVAFEGGIEQFDVNVENANYLADGFYILGGLDKNMLKKHPTDLLGAGFRIGYSKYSHSAENITIVNDYWADYTASLSEETMQAFWGEVVISLKGEIFKNIYLGWSMRIKILIQSDNGEQMTPYHIPGFGDSQSSVNLGATYSVFYKIPFGK